MSLALKRGCRKIGGVLSGGTLNVLLGGTASNVMLSGTDIISRRGVASNTTVLADRSRRDSRVGFGLDAENLETERRMTSGASATNSAAYSRLGSATSAPQRYSISTLRPRVQPSCCSA